MEHSTSNWIVAIHLVTKGAESRSHRRLHVAKVERKPRLLYMPCTQSVFHLRGGCPINFQLHNREEKKPSVMSSKLFFIAVPISTNLFVFIKAYVLNRLD